MKIKRRSKSHLGHRSSIWPMLHFPPRGLVLTYTLGRRQPGPTGQPFNPCNPYFACVTYMWDSLCQPIPLINPTESGGRSRHYRGLGCGDRAQRLTPISPGSCVARAHHFHWCVGPSRQVHLPPQVLLAAATNRDEFGVARSCATARTPSLPL